MMVTMERASLAMFASVWLTGHVAAESPDFSGVRGVVIDHSPQSSGLYIGSPSIAVLSDGAYLASHDFVGPKSQGHECPTTVVFRSGDRGAMWRQIARLRCLFWPNLYVHKGAVYLFGIDKHHGRIVIRRLTDGGVTWTEPRDSSTGLLAPEGPYHTAPMPVVVHEGRLWRAVEDARGGKTWGARYRAGMLSVPVHADLLKAENWTFRNFLPRDPAWLDGNFGGWLEGNAVVTRDGRLVDILRVHVSHGPERAAIVLIAFVRVAPHDALPGCVGFQCRRVHPPASCPSEVPLPPAP